ncbi:MAG: ABC transporter ATP-binding protein [SAR202 cluster bacterium]|nr:ABC transporter ATP-binding protein [SAR202 cluster bacterium]
MGEILTAIGLVRSYDSDGTAYPALRGVELSIQEGEFVAVMGASGCGKSTLLHLVGGIDRPDAGEIRLRGTRVDTLTEGQAAVMRRTDVGYVFQFFNLIGNLTVADNVELPALMAGFSASDARKRRIELLEELGIAEHADKVPGKLSGGQQQRVAIARALIHGPAVLLADEPTGNLDSVASQEVVDLLKRYHNAGQTILMVTHDARVSSAADRVLQMRDGQIVRETYLDKQRDARSLVSNLVQLEV